MTPARYARPPKFDRLTRPDASRAETEMHYCLGPYDEAIRAAELKWGVDRLPSLVPVDMALKYGKAVGALNDAIRADDLEAVRQNAINCTKGLAALDRAATEAGATKADPHVWEMGRDDFRFAIIKDDRAWPALKAARPDLLFFTEGEVISALMAWHTRGPVVETAERVGLNATVTPFKARPKKDADLDDEIPW